LRLLRLFAANGNPMNQGIDCREKAQKSQRGDKALLTTDYTDSTDGEMNLTLYLSVLIREISG
jgi:hypothetical protein